jgi:hypothetical protein
MRGFQLSLVMIVALTVAGCGKHLTEVTMVGSFTPPNIKSLADIDVADTSYGDECVVIQGIVSPSSQGGWPGQNDQYKVHCFTFAAWHRLGEAIVKRDLNILRPVAPDADYFDDLPAYSIHRMSVLLSADRTRAIFEKPLPLTEPGEDLLAFGNELRKPVVISTETFGDLVLNRQIGWFEGKVNWNGVRVAVHFHTDENNSIESGLRTAETLCSDQSQWKRKVDAFAVKELLSLKNDSWLEDDEAPLTAAEFIRRMKLESISISGDGDFEFWHNDGDLFWGHSIQIRGNLKEGLTDADIPG